MTAPKGLGNRGRALWRSVAKGLPAGWELDEREVALLTLAARQADDLSRLETAIKNDGAMSVGSQGQPIVHPAVVEARQARIAISRLLGELALPDEQGAPLTAAGRRGRKAAESRWHHRDAERRAAAEGV